MKHEIQRGHLSQHNPIHAQRGTSSTSITTWRSAWTSINFSESYRLQIGIQRLDPGCPTCTEPHCGRKEPSLITGATTSATIAQFSATHDAARCDVQMLLPTMGQPNYSSCADTSTRYSRWS